MADARIELTDKLSDQLWRLHNLYWVVNKDGQRVRFQPNWAQIKIIEEMRQNHLVLKARQLGASMGLQILGLDCSLFIPNWNSVTIAHERGALEKMFRKNVEYPFNSLPEQIREAKRGKTNRSHELAFSNGSSISVALSTRSGTVNYLHVSEFGKVCAKYPLKAKEIVTGAFPSVPQSGFKVIESTAEGQSGKFYNLCQEALNQQRERRPLSSRDWSITFLPWWKHPDYVASPKNVVIPPKLREYFEELEGKIGQKLGMARKAWYTGEWKEQGPDIKREHPSTPEEAFEQALEGAYYANEMAKVRTEGRITSIPYERGVPVDTWWDIGVRDSTTIWFVQHCGREIHLIDYYSASGEGLQHYVSVLREKSAERDWLYGRHVAPHDMKVREFGSEAKPRHEIASGLGVHFEICPQGIFPPGSELAEGIEAVRNALDRCWFDAERCEEGIKCLDSYRKQWDEVRAVYSKTPVHDWASHGADSFRIGVLGGGRTYRPAAKAVQKTRAIV